MPPRTYVLTDDDGRPHDVHVAWRQISHVSRLYGARTIWSRWNVTLANGGIELIEQRSGGRWRAMFSKSYYNGKIPRVVEG